jgi:hypothetical protein
VGAWYTIGVFVGLGVGLGVLFAGLLSAGRAALLAALTLAVGVGVAIGFAFETWPEAVGAAAGGGAGTLGAAQIVRGALHRGGTRFGMAALVAVTAALLAGLAFVPALGYVEALIVPGLAARLRRQAGRRYAGLRILARD